MSVIDSALVQIRQLQPYSPGKPVEELERELGISNAIKLASNENPLGFSPRVAEVLASASEHVADILWCKGGVHMNACVGAAPSIAHLAQGLWPNRRENEHRIWREDARNLSKRRVGPARR